MYSNYDQLVPARVAGIFFLFILFILLTVGSKAHASCLSFLPHGYNGAFVHLPKSTKFCVETKDGRVDYHTNEFYARVIGAQTSLPPIQAQKHASDQEVIIARVAQHTTMQRK